MRGTALLVALAIAHATSAAADGDASAIEKVVRDHVAAIATIHVDDAVAAQTMTAQPLILSGQGAVVPSESEAAVFVQTATDVDVSYALSGVSVVPVGHGAAWFRADVAETIVWRHGNRTHPAVRMRGVAVDDHGWKIASVMYAVALPDKTLVAKAIAAPARGAPTVTGDQTLAAAVAAWITNGFAGGPGAGAVASGTAPTEHASGKQLAALVRGWAKLGLYATTIDARVLAGGAIGVARAEVAMPITRGAQKGKAAPLVLEAIAVPDGTTWRWVSLSFATPVVDPYDPLGE